MKNFKIVFAVLLVLLSTTLSAHTKLSTSSPKDGSEEITAPESLVLTFSGNVKLLKVKLLKVKLKSEKKEIKVNFKISATPRKVYEISLPKLNAGQYQAQWIAMGADTHKMKGTVSFKVID